MPRARRELPRVGELVVGTVKKIYDYGAYLTLDEYEGLEAYLPWSEITSRWVRNIRDVIKEGQKVVVKVIRVNRRKMHVDVSLKRVSDSERKRKMMEWKRAQKALKIMEIIAERLGKSLDEVLDTIGRKLEDYYGELMAGLEQAAMRGIEAVLEAGVDESVAPIVVEEAKKHIEIRRVKVMGTLTLRSLASDGVERIREVLIKARDAAASTARDVQVKIYTIGAPRYRLEITANTYKTAEKALKNALNTAEKLAGRLGVEYSFHREYR